MENTPQQELIAAIRAGNLAAVQAALAAGADCDGADDHGVPGLPLRIACFNGQLDIVRELASKGASVTPDHANPLADNLVSLAVRGGQKDTVRLLIELGAEVPAGLQTGLSLLELLAAQGVANRSGRDKKAAPPANRPAPPRIVESAPAAPAADAERANLPDWMAQAAGEIEQIDLQGCVGVDTNALNDDVMRLANASGQGEPAEEGKHLDQPSLNFGSKFKFWKKS